MLLHVHQVAQSRHRTIIITSDTDVEDLARYRQATFKNQLSLVTWSQQKQRIIDTEGLPAEWSQEVCQSFTGLHAFTGSDATSVFSGKDKKTFFEMLDRDEVVKPATQRLVTPFWSVQTFSLYMNS